MSTGRPTSSPIMLNTAKRRRLRKGTTSCWECKRRKMKCEYNEGSDETSCKPCIKRHSQCISQELPESHSLLWNKNNNTSEILPQEKSATPSVDESRVSYSTTAPACVRALSFYDDQSLQQCNAEAARISSRGSKYDGLARFLHRSLPSREDAERIFEANPHPTIYAHEIMTMPYTTLTQTDLEGSEYLLEAPDADAHPVLIARYMLLLASILQHLHPDVHHQIKALKESPQVLSNRMADLAIDLVTTKDELLGSIEGLECIMIESVYHANMGNFRRSWIAGRRAVNIAQLMGLNRFDHHVQYERLDPKTRHHPQVIWSRIVFLDRFLCLILGLPQGCTDPSMGSEAMLRVNIPVQQLERIHCVVAARILERNKSRPSPDDLTLTRTFDKELQRAVRNLPSKWWVKPDLELARKDSRALFWNTGRLFAQVLHFNLLNQLHLPYLLRSSLAEPGYEYSRTTCVNASREILTRFISLRSFNEIASSCRIVDFLALMAAVTLLLAHMDSCLSGTENILAHQYPSDRAMIEQVQENMEEFNRHGLDALSIQSTDLIRQLLAIEVDGHVRRVSVHESYETSETVLSSQNGDTAVRVHIPYFGIIKIARDGVSKENHYPKSTNTNTAPTATPMDADYSQIEALPVISETTNSASLDPDYNQVGAPLGISETYGNVESQVRPFDISITGPKSATSISEMHSQNGIFDSVLHTGAPTNPGLATTADNWPFQGADWAFFESLMRNNGDPED